MHAAVWTLEVVQPQLNIQDMIRALIAETRTYVASKKLTASQVSSMTVKLNAAIAACDQLHYPPAKNQVNAFVNDQQAAVRSGKLSAADAQHLIDLAHAITKRIENTVNGR
jgi:hypothetical protein